MIVLPYLGPSAARREQALPLPARVSATNAQRVSARLGADGDPLAGAGIRLTYRTSLVLRCIASRPGASNRVVAEHAEVSDPGQISKLLRRLERLGLLVNTSGGHQSGEPNAWELTSHGLQVAQRLSIHTPQSRKAIGE